MRLVPPVPTGDTEEVRRLALLAVHTSPLDQPGSGDGGGLNVYVLEVARRFAARGVEVDIFTRATDADTPPATQVAEGLTVHRIAAGPKAPLPKERLPSHLCEFHLNLLRHPTAGTHDVVHAHYWLSGWVGRRVAERWGVPLVQTFHTIGAVKNETRAPGQRPEAALRLVAEQRIADAADRIAVLTCGEAAVLHQRMGVSGSRITVVPAGVDLDVFRPDSSSPAGGAEAWPDGDGPTLLFVGRLQPLKGPDVAIRTLAEIRRSHAGARLLIVGGPSGEAAHRTEVEDLDDVADELGVRGAVAIAPARPQVDLANLYRQADLLLVPSRSETFGLVALEAQACGTPVVAADVGGLRAVVRRGGVLVHGHAAVDHAEAASRLLDDPDVYAAARAAGLATARTASWDRTVDRLGALYADAKLGTVPLDQHLRSPA